MGRLRFLPSREEAERLRIAVNDQVLFNRAVYKIEVLGMRFCHLRAADGSTVKFARLTDCHKLTGDESPMDSFAGTQPFDKTSILKHR